MDDFSGLETVLQNIQDIIMPSGVEAAVQDIIAPRCLDDIANEYARINEEDGKVLRDSKLADSLLGSKSENKKPALNTVDANFVNNGRGKLTTSRDGLPRKRTRAGSDRGGRDQARMEEKLIKDKMMDRRFGPGMWDGILS